MPNSYTCLRYHVIFSTKNRRPQIADTIRPRLYEYLGGIARDNAGRMIACGGTADHIHLLLSWRPQCALSDVVREMKAGSSRWIHETFAKLEKFAWQDGYGAFTVSQSSVESVKRYIAEQGTHHRRVSFQEEFVEFLQRHGVAYEERYIWG